MVAATPNTLHLVGDEDCSKRRQILDGARKVFMDLGFDGASMGEIARAGRRLQGHALRLLRRQEPAVRGHRRGRSARTGQGRLQFRSRRATSRPRCANSARPISSWLCRPGGGSAIRTVMAIAERMPEVGRRFYENVLEKTINRLADYLEAHVAAGRSCDRRLPARGVAIHEDVPGVAVPAVRLPGRPRAFGRAHRRSGRKRDADVSGGVSGEAGVTRVDLPTPQCATA